ncbi:hypothetical protein E1B28_001600 [Marasmius oreades]|uniref:Transcription factor CBF/NF-Y/archaeal histone domain-containing protein n=1 Tax=Marasmius oreades TaxID=181124 RepID=A0A9P7V3T5_9AGAR|nr:uncharacterized protein E1B28_001600 [Marasmius oreades]KAG7099788.1 hypothetical protein E1B28_001600 [Marasmius oreades]
MAAFRPTPPLIQTELQIPSSNGDSRSDEAEDDEVISDDDDQVDQLESDESDGEDESAEDHCHPGEGRRHPGQPLLPAVRIENILHADGVTGSLALSKEGLFIVSAATEEFIKRLAQGGHRQANSEVRNTVTYQDLANTTRQYQEFMFLTDMIPSPIPLAEALELRQERIRSMFSEDESSTTTTALPRPQQNHHPPNHNHAETSTSPKSKPKPRANGKEKTNGFVHTTAQPPAPNGPAHGTPAVLDARPWTHWSEPITFQTTRPTPIPVPSTDSNTAHSSQLRSSEEKDSPRHPPAQLAGPASGFITATNSISLSGENQNTGRTIYSQKS